MAGDVWEGAGEVVEGVLGQSQAEGERGDQPC